MSRPSSGDGAVIFEPVDRMQGIFHVLRDHDQAEQQVTYLELFFDLVFVFAITQLSQVLLNDLTWRGVAGTFFLLVAMWLAWVYTTWWTNSVDPDVVPVRLVMLVMMLAGMMMALAIPEAWGDRALLFAVSYVGLHLIRNTFSVLAARRSGGDHISLLRLLSWSVVTGALWIAGAIAGNGALVVIWVLALALELVSPYVGYWTPGLGAQRMGDRQIEYHHFTERFHLFIIIVLGESIVITGVTAAALELDAARLASVVVAFALTAVLWWLYFNAVAARSSEGLGAASGDRQRLARDAYSYTHILLVFGIMLIAIGNELLIGHPLDEFDRAGLVVVAAGPVLYLWGHELFKLLMTGSVRVVRLLGGVLIAAVVAVVGTVLPALWTQAIVLAILVGFAIHENVAMRRFDATSAEERLSSLTTEAGKPAQYGSTRVDRRTATTERSRGEI
ncbi:MAG: low temperature requirement protein A [Acidobacteria bacterium]|nr:low temperature requirement protein A [Acidobacteriota bacterium]TDI52508.1 MAG: low temperature requirement protein A [Acidobacteriota bacterium]TDI53708.1 MAG: low temperature requirement protein A [Acidobacteriota bacterium]